MPKKILYESAVHQFLWAAKRLSLRLAVLAPSDAEVLARWLSSIALENAGRGTMKIAWTFPQPGFHLLPFKGAKFYTRGDSESYRRNQAALLLPFSDDRVMEDNITFFDQELGVVLNAAGLFPEESLARFLRAGPLPAAAGVQDRKHAEIEFHDEWAGSENLGDIDVRQRNEACTAPEMRRIRKSLGDLRGKSLLDVGCGLGEAAVYFALEGADVTASDISPGMCDAAAKLAADNGVTLQTHVSASEDVGLGHREFDVVYMGNVLHHVDIRSTLDNVLPHLKAGGIFVSWDPVAYNPLINIYRAIATKVRTKDESPLRLQDIRAITSRFESAEVTWFWLTTLLVFILMFAVQFRSPNKERFWKTVVDEADSWAWIYRPLAAVDRFLLALLPFLRPLCWNVVIVARRPIRVNDK